MLLASISAKGLFVALALSTDLFSLLGGENDSTLALLNAHLSDRIRVLCTTADAVRAAKEVAELDELPDVDELLSYYAAHGGGLLSPRDRERLEKGEYEKIRRSITRMDYGGMGLVPKADDHLLSHPLLSQTPHPVHQQGGGWGAGATPNSAPCRAPPVSYEPLGLRPRGGPGDWGPGAGEAKNTV